MRVKNGTILCQEGCHLDELFLLLTGCVYRESEAEKKLGLPAHYLIEGTIFGEKEVLFDRECSATYTALCDCYILKITKKSFLSLMDTCETFRNEIVNLARGREKIRLK